MSDQTVVVMHHKGPTTNLSSEDWQAYAIGPFPSEEMAKAFHLALVECDCQKILMECTLPPFIQMMVLVDEGGLIKAWEEIHAEMTQRRDLLN